MVIRTVKKQLLFVCRLHGGPESSMVYAQTGRMYDSARQYSRAAHYYKLHIMANFGSGYLPGDNEEYSALICLAGAYDWDSVSTGPHTLLARQDF